MLKFYQSYVIIWSEKWMIHIIHSNGSDINVIIGGDRKYYMCSNTCYHFNGGDRKYYVQ